MELNTTTIIIVLVALVLIIIMMQQNENMDNTSPDPRGTYIESPGILYFFNDLNSALPLVKLTADQCKNACANNPNCYGWSHNSTTNDCAFKNSGNPQTTVQGDAFKNIKSGFYYNCNGCKDPRGKYKETVGSLSVGYDIPQTTDAPITTEDGCRQKCINTHDCVGWTYNQGKCAIKNGFVPRLIFPNFTTAKSGMYVPCYNSCYSKPESPTITVPPVTVPPVSTLVQTEQEQEQEPEQEQQAILLPPQEQQGLSKGAIAGIISGVLVAIAIIIFAIYKLVTKNNN